MLHIKHLELSIDAPLRSSQAQTLAHDLAHAIQESWNAAGPQPRLCIDRLTVQADAADLQGPAFVGEIAARTVADIRSARLGQSPQGTVPAWE